MSQMLVGDLMQRCQDPCHHGNDPHLEEAAGGPCPYRCKWCPYCGRNIREAYYRSHVEQHETWDAAGYSDRLPEETLTEMKNHLLIRLKGSKKE